MAEEQAPPAESELTFSIKASGDAKYNLTLPSNTTVADVKTKLSGEDYANIATDRIRLIYSGRVLKDGDTLSSVKIKDGHTVHLVKGAASNARQNPAAGSSGPSAVPQVPSNIASGTGNDTLAGLTGARYAGMHGLPGADAFGADGGMGAPQGPEDMLRMMENPMFLSQMNEAMNNPDVIRMMQQNPMIRDNPMARQMLENPDFRRQLLNPDMIRMQMQMQRAMGGGGMGGNSAFPAPGVTDTTAQTGSGTTNATSGADGNTTGSTAPPLNPFAAFSQANAGGAGAGAAAGGNPFAALFGPGGANPLGGNTAPLGGPQQGGDQFGNMMREMMQSMGQAGGGGQDPFSQYMRAMGQGQGQDQGQGGGNPFAGMFNPGMFGGLGQQQQERSLEEDRALYQDQLVQLAGMGFPESRSIRALRMSNGDVNAAVNLLVDGTC